MDDVFSLGNISPAIDGRDFRRFCALLSRMDAAGEIMYAHVDRVDETLIRLSSFDAKTQTEDSITLYADGLETLFSPTMRGFRMVAAGVLMLFEETCLRGRSFSIHAPFDVRTAQEGWNIFAKYLERRPYAVLRLDDVREEYRASMDAASVALSESFHENSVPNAYTIRKAVEDAIPDTGYPWWKEMISETVLAGPFWKVEAEGPEGVRVMWAQDAYDVKLAIATMLGKDPAYFYRETVCVRLGGPAHLCGKTTPAGEAEWKIPAEMTVRDGEVEVRVRRVSFDELPKERETFSLDTFRFGY